MFPHLLTNNAYSPLQLCLHLLRDQISVNGSWHTSYGRDGRSEPGCPNLTVSAARLSDVTIFFDTVTRIAEAGREDEFGFPQIYVHRYFGESLKLGFLTRSH